MHDDVLDGKVESVPILEMCIKSTSHHIISLYWELYGHLSPHNFFIVGTCTVNDHWNCGRPY